MVSTAAAAKLLQDEKNSHAAKNDIEPCTNVHCTYPGCMCGRKCGCKIPDTKKVWIQKNRKGNWMSSCEPCQASWDAAADENDTNADENGTEEVVSKNEESPSLAKKLICCLFPWARSRDGH